MQNNINENSSFDEKICLDESNKTSSFFFKSADINEGHEHNKNLIPRFQISNIIIISIYYV